MLFSGPLELTCVRGIAVAAFSHHLTQYEHAVAGVEVHTFHARDSSLPALPDGAWPRLLQASSTRRPATGSAQGSATAAGEAAGQGGGTADMHSNGNGSTGCSDAEDAAAPSSGAAAFLLAEPRFSDVKALAPFPCNFSVSSAEQSLCAT